MKMNLRKIAMGLGLCIALVACSKEEETIVFLEEIHGQRALFSGFYQTIDFGC